MLGEVGQDQPPFALRREVLREPVQKVAQDGRARVIDPLLQSGRRTTRNPRRVAHHHVGPPGVAHLVVVAIGPQVGLHHVHPVRQPQPTHVVARALHRARVDVGRHDLPGPAPGQDGREHPGAGADVPHDRIHDALRPGGVGDQVEVLVTGGGEHAVGGMDPGPQRGHLDAAQVPLISTDDAEELGQRDQRLPPGGVVSGVGRGPVGVGAGVAHVGRSAQPNCVVLLQWDEDLSQRLRPLRACLPVGEENVAGVGALRCPGRPLLQTAVEGAHELAGVVEVAPPQQGGAPPDHP